jgi:hypothetical protein
MLPLTDSLWRKLDDAYREQNVPELLLKLSQSWSDEDANDLFWGALCHQGTCYGATFAAIPHLLSIAEPETNHHQRREIAYFLGHVALCTRSRRGDTDSEPDLFLEELPRTLAGWDAKLDSYRYLVTSYGQAQVQI